MSILKPLICGKKKISIFNRSYLHGKFNIWGGFKNFISVFFFLNVVVCFVLSFLLFLDQTYSFWKFLGQGSNLCHSMTAPDH